MSAVTGTEVMAEAVMEEEVMAAAEVGVAEETVEAVEEVARKVEGV